jgi:plasmid stability protein
LTARFDVNAFNAKLTLALNIPWITAMAVLTVRNVPDSVRDRLRLRAARAGTSMEEQVRLILLQASLAPEKAVGAASLPAWVAALYGQNKPAGVVDALLLERAAAESAEQASLKIQ